MPTLTVIIASTRPGRAGLPIGHWFAGRAGAHGSFDVRVVDLAELALPLLDEPHHPRLGQYVHQHSKDWSATVAGSDAFVLVTPEYNHGYPASLKNALDYLHAEWAHKPVGFVSYGGVAAGTRAVQQLKPVLAALKMLPVVEAVAIPDHVQHLHPEQGFVAPPATEAAADAMLDELVAAEHALRSRRARPARAA